MQKIFKISILFSSLALIMMSTGCLKDELADNEQSVPKISESANVIELPGPLRVTDSYRTSYAVSLFSSDKDTTFNLVPIRLASDQPASEDIQVELELVPSLLSAYNDSTGTNLIEPAPSLYQFSNGLSITIPKGSREGFLQITTIPNNLVGVEYGFGIRIKSISNTKYIISGNFNNAVVIVGVRNKYDGVYSLRIKTTGWAAYGIADGVTYGIAYKPPSSGIGMITASGNSVLLYNYSRGDNLQPAFTSTADPTAFGATSPLFTFDLATDVLLSVTNTTPDDGRGRVFVPNPAVTDNRYDPATKTIYASYLMKQNGRPNQAIYDTLVFGGDRP